MSPVDLSKTFILEIIVKSRQLEFKRKKLKKADRFRGFPR